MMTTKRFEKHVVLKTKSDIELFGYYNNLFEFDNSLDRFIRKSFSDILMAGTKVNALICSNEVNTSINIDKHKLVDDDVYIVSTHVFYGNALIPVLDLDDFVVPNSLISEIKNNGCSVKSAKPHYVNEGM